MIAPTSRQDDRPLDRSDAAASCEPPGAVASSRDRVAVVAIQENLDCFVAALLAMTAASLAPKVSC
jgi:hypothetical protein